MSVCSGRGIVSDSTSSVAELKRHSSTRVACSENSAKFTPMPSQVAPSGYGAPGQTRNDAIGTEKPTTLEGTCRVPRAASEDAELRQEPDGDQDGDHGDEDEDHHTDADEHVVASLRGDAWARVPLQQREV